MLQINERWLCRRAMLKDIVTYPFNIEKKEDNMRKKIITAGLSIILLLFLFIGFYAIGLESATCSSSTGDICVGQCCIANFHTCVAGPCSTFMPPLK
jgi:hypothetical protein